MEEYIIYLTVILSVVVFIYWIIHNQHKRILITQYYIPEWKERQLEINECLVNNVDNSLLDEIHLFVEKDYDFSWIQHNPNFHKIKLIRTKGRLSYKQAFDYSKQSLSSNDIIILANSDIYFDETLSHINSIDLTNTFLGLTRHEIKGLTLELYERPEVSQDVWIWKSPLQIKDIPENKDYFEDGIQLGIWGCDNRILKIVSDSGYNIRNIGRNIRCIHNHKNDLRTWSTDPQEVKKKYWSPGNYIYLDCE